MSDFRSKKKTPDKEKLAQVVAEARQNRDQRERGYREQALKLYPWVCGRCGREFTLKNLHELTVHHRDHNHDNNPSDGSNWELLCLYCHDNEHARYEEYVASKNKTLDRESGRTATYNPFADLKKMMENKS